VGSLGQAGIRLLAFGSALTLLLLWEARSPARQSRISRRVRWSANFLLGAGNAILLRVIYPAGLVGVAAFAARRGLGVFNILTSSRIAAAGASIVLLDLTVYLQHRLFHAIPWLWQIHRLHHADVELDVSTALRFHPAEAAMSLLIKAAAVIALGMPAAAVLAFEIILNTAAMFNHANASLPAAAEPRLRLLVVTPAMHRVHHSTSSREANTNFGFSLSCWDRLFGTHRPTPDWPPSMPARIGLPQDEA
jgi:sterol desaturase/sphingolipid hydroxylase (fatty acid hydroxylase superfamily)